MKYQYIICIALLSMANLAWSETTIINNYGSNGNNNPPPPPSAAGPSEPYIPAGVYRDVHRDGSTDTVYTTGTKQPFYVTPPNSNNIGSPEVDVGWQQPQNNEPNPPRHR